MLLLDNPVRAYGWGSTTVIPDLLGREPDSTPHAELWVGAHPDDPSRIAGTADTLLTHIDADLDSTLGDAVLDTLGARLPFLLKLLAVEKPLSLQVHPSRAQARAGYRAEQAAGIASNAPERNYRDDNHKPELICALSTFDALCGLRPVEATRRFLDALAVPALQAETARLEAGGDGVRDVVARWLRLDDARVADRVTDVRSAAATLVGDDEFSLEGETIAQLAAAHPGDGGVLVALLLNRVRLAPGEALYLPAGRPHAYLHGTGVEIMASSDNVLRGGLTDKHVDVDELLRVLDPTPAPVEVLRPVPTAAGATYDVALPDFALSMLHLDGVAFDLPSGSPQLMLALSTGAVVDQQGHRTGLSPGQAAFVGAQEPQVRVSGSGLVARATTGRAVAAALGDQAG